MMNLLIPQYTLKYVFDLFLTIVPSFFLFFFFYISFENFFLDLDEINYLGNVHNAVYFAVKVLATQKRYCLLLFVTDSVHFKRDF